MPSRASNHPALAWLIAHAFGNFFGVGVWGFMQTLPQINLYTHGTARVVPTGSLTVPDRKGCRMDPADLTAARTTE